MERIETLDRVVPVILKESGKLTASAAAGGFIIGLAIRRPFNMMVFTSGLAAGHCHRASNLYLQQL